MLLCLIGKDVGMYPAHYARDTQFLTHITYPVTVICHGSENRDPNNIVSRERLFRGFFKAAVQEFYIVFLGCE